MVENADKLLKKLNQIADDKIVETALKTVGVYVEGQAKENCPSDTGFLRQSITSYAKDTTAVIGTNASYSPFIEIGTGLWAGTSPYSPEFKGTGRQTPWHYQDNQGQWHTTIGQHPHPFLKPAVDNHKAQINKIFNDKVKEELDKL